MPLDDFLTQAARRRRSLLEIGPDVPPGPLAGAEFAFDPNAEVPRLVMDAPPARPPQQPSRLGTTAVSYAPAQDGPPPAINPSPLFDPSSGMGARATSPAPLDPAMYDRAGRSDMGQPAPAVDPNVAAGSEAALAAKFGFDTAAGMGKPKPRDTVLETTPTAAFDPLVGYNRGALFDSPIGPVLIPRGQTAFDPERLRTDPTYAREIASMPSVVGARTQAIGDDARREALMRDFAQGELETGKKGVRSQRGLLGLMDPGNALARQGFFPEDNVRALQIQQGQVNQSQQDQAGSDKMTAQREQLASEERRAKLAADTQREVAGSKKDRAEIGLISTLAQNPAYQNAPLPVKQKMEQDARRLAGIFDQPQQPQPITVGPPGVQPPGGSPPPPPGPPPPDQAVSSAYERARQAIAGTKAQQSTLGIPAQPGYEYTTDKAGALLDTLADPALSPQQRQQVILELSQTGGVDVKQLGDAMVKASAQAAFRTAPEGTFVGDQPNQRTFDGIPGLAVNRGAGLGVGLRALASGLNRGSVYDSATYNGTTVPLDVSDVGYSRLPTSLVQRSQWERRLQAAQQLLPFLSQRGLYGERPMPR